MTDTTGSTPTTTPDGPSPEYTVTIHQGAADVLTDCVRRVQEASREAEANPESYEDLARKREAVIEEMFSLVKGLYSVLLSNEHDNNVHIFPDGQLSFFWRYDSGYHGGLNRDERRHRWTINT